MVITEPITLLTDYAITIETGLFALILNRLGYRSKCVATHLWAVAFLCVAIAAFLGGSYHGFTLYLNLSISQYLWQSTLIAISLASFFMLVAVSLQSLPVSWQPWLISTVAVSLWITHNWPVMRDGFANTLLSYLIALLVVILLRTISPYPGKGFPIWFACGFLVSCIAAAIQATQFNLFPSVNHNDLYHIVQMLALYLIYRGAISLNSVST